MNHRYFYCNAIYSFIISSPVMVTRRPQTIEKASEALAPIRPPCFWLPVRSAFSVYAIKLNTTIKKFNLSS